MDWVPRDANEDLKASWHPVHFAAERNDVNAIRREIPERGNPLVEVETVNGSTPLMIASGTGCIEAVKVLLELGADIDRQRADGETALHVAISSGTLDAALFLISVGAKTEIANEVFQTPIFLCASEGKLELAKILVEEHHVDINRVDRFGETPFSLADRNGMWEVALYLWKTMEFRKLMSDDKSATISKNRKYSGTWTKPYTVGDVPPNGFLTQIAKSSKGEFFLFGGYLPTRLYDKNIYQIDFESKEMTLFEAIPKPSTAAAVHQDEEQAIQAMKLSQSSLTFERVGSNLVLKPSDIIDHSCHDDTGGSFASAIANAPFLDRPESFGISYFEVTIIYAGARAAVAVGLIPEQYDIDTDLPGWKLNSWAYHSDLGKVFSCLDVFNYSTRSSTGDVIGCGFIYGTREVFFTKNGEYLGIVTINADISRPLYPGIGLTSSATVGFNFGKKPFMFGFNVPTIRSTIIATIPVDMLARYHLSFFIEDKIVFLSITASHALSYDVIERKFSTRQQVEYNPKIRGYEQIGVVGKDVWFYSSSDDEDKFCYDIQQMLFYVLNTETLKWRTQIIDLRASGQFTSPIIFLYSRTNIPVIDRNKMYFLHAKPPFYIDATENLAYPIELQPTHRSNINCSFALYKDSDNNDNVVVFGGSYAPSNMDAEASQLYMDVGGYTNFLSVVDLSTKSTYKASLLGSLAPLEKDYATLFSIDSKRIGLFGGDNCVPLNFFEIFTMMDEALQDDRLVSLYDKPDISDIRIQALGSDKPIYAHKVVLYTRWESLKPRLNADTTLLEMEHPYDLVYHLVRYLYSDNVSLMLPPERYYAFVQLVEKEAPEHYQRVAGSLLLTHFENKSLMSSQLSLAFNNPLFSDLEIEVQGNVFYGHKSILCSRNDYFRALCLGGLSETGKKRLVLQELEHEPFCKAVRYIYDSRLRLQEIEEDIVQVLCTAVRLRIDGLTTALEDVLCHNITQENVQLLTTISEEQMLHKLAKSCARFVVNTDAAEGLMQLCS